MTDKDREKEDIEDFAVLLKDSVISPIYKAYLQGVIDSAKILSRPYISNN